MSTITRPPLLPQPPDSTAAAACPPPPFVPSVEHIAAQTAAIRATWFAEEHPRPAACNPAHWKASLAKGGGK